MIEIFVMCKGMMDFMVICVEKNLFLWEIFGCVVFMFNVFDEYVIFLIIVGCNDFIFFMNEVV